MSKEKEFEDLYNKINLEIQYKLKKAASLVNEATALSEKYGVPFIPIDFPDIGMVYAPYSFDNKHPDVDVSILCDICDLGLDDDNFSYRGWIFSSDIC